jgi:demethylmenaquinone methyltransferase/2-methoxy-6-polyprenyl-1,4-benzoquinol methylase
MVDVSTDNRYYAARASEYDDIYRKPERQPDLRQIEKWLPPFLASRKVLEIACGTGYWTQFIAPTAEHVVALDNSAEVIDIAKTRVPANKVTFHVADAYQLPSDLEICNAAFAGFWFSHVPKRRRGEFLRGLNTRLAPGATVLLLDNRYVPGSSSEIAGINSDGDTFQMRKLKDGSTHRVLKNFPAESELQMTLQELGLTGTYTAWPYYWAVQYTVASLTTAVGCDRQLSGYQTNTI